jgi:DNA polymerase
MKKLHIDVETRSSVNLKTEGVHKYVEAPDFEILLFAYSIDEAPVEIVDLKNCDAIPRAVMVALSDPLVEKHAFNATFERVCLETFFRIKTPLSSWRCSSVLAVSHGLPGSLRLCAAALKLTVQKLRDGEALIRKFSVAKPGDKPFFGGDDWQTFKDYCVGDVLVEIEVANALKHLPGLPLFELHNYQTDQVINDRGVRVDLEFARICIGLDDANVEELESEAKELTGLENPNSVAQLKKFLSEQTGQPVTSLNKKDVDEIDVSGSAVAERVLQIRKETGRSSTAKYRTMLRVVCKDGRLHGMFRFYGAGRTGRFSSKFVQLQNMPGANFKGLERARKTVLLNDLDLIRMTEESVADVMVALIRTALVAKPGHKLVCADLSSIEARILSWLAGEEWRLKVFEGDGKIYEASAAAMFGVPVESIDKEHPLRKRGKVAELACGYGGGVQALINMGALREGVPESELLGIRDAWRSKNPKIVRLWRSVGDAAMTAVRTGQAAEVAPYGLRFMVRESQGRKWLYVRLPSGRNLAYFNPLILKGDKGDELSYMKYDSDGSLLSGAFRVRTYGAKLVENIVQAIARDVLCVGLWRVEHAGFPVVLHVHDEIVAEVPDAVAEDALKSIESLMSRPVAFAPGLTLGAEGFISPYYRK